MLKNIYQGENAPCKGCDREEKSIGCHGRCEAYVSYHERMEAEKAERRKKRDVSEGLYWLSMRRHRR